MSLSPLSRGGHMRLPTPLRTRNGNTALAGLSSSGRGDWRTPDSLMDGMPVPFLAHAEQTSRSSACAELTIR